MSAKVTTWVWENSRAEGLDRLVLLAIADCCNDQGESAPLAETDIAAKARVCVRTVRGALSVLSEMGELNVERVDGKPSSYRAPMTDHADITPISTPANRAGVRCLPRHGLPGYPGKPCRGRENPLHAVELKDQKQLPPPTPPQRSEPVREDVERICSALAESVESNGSRRPAVTVAWRREARLLLDKDGRSEEQVMAAIRWCGSDEFWKGVVLSMRKLRARYDQMRLAAQRQRAPGRLSPGDRARARLLGATR
jgi:hypothetical protein